MRNRQGVGQPELAAVVEAYWQQLRRGQIVPYRSEVDPRKLDAALPHAFIAERIASGMARLRIAGAEVNAVLGMETRGMPLTALIAPDHRTTFTLALQQLFQEPALIRCELAADAGLGHPALSARMILLPMRDDMGGITRVLGCLETQGRIGRTPRRFDVVRVEAETLGTQPTAQPDVRTVFEAGPMTTLDDFAEAQRPYMANPSDAPGRETRVPWLRVIDNE